MVKLVATAGTGSCDAEQNVLVGNRGKQSLWERHPFGKNLLNKVVAFHEAQVRYPCACRPILALTSVLQGDVDTLAALGTNMSPNVAVLHNNEPIAPVYAVPSLRCSQLSPTLRAHRPSHTASLDQRWEELTSNAGVSLVRVSSSGGGGRGIAS